MLGVERGERDGVIERVKDCVVVGEVDDDIERVGERVNNAVWLSLKDNNGYADIDEVIVIVEDILGDDDKEPVIVLQREI